MESSLLIFNLLFSIIREEKNKRVRLFVCTRVRGKVLRQVFAGQIFLLKNRQRSQSERGIWIRFSLLPFLSKKEKVKNLLFLLLLFSQQEHSVILKIDSHFFYPTENQEIPTVFSKSLSVAQPQNLPHLIRLT